MNTAAGLESINIGTARWLCNKNGLDGVVVIAFGDGIKSVSYGSDMRKCRQLGKVIDFIGDLIESGALNVSEFEQRIIEHSA